MFVTTIVYSAVLLAGLSPLTDDAAGAAAADQAANDQGGAANKAGDGKAADGKAGDKAGAGAQAAKKKTPTAGGTCAEVPANAILKSLAIGRAFQGNEAAAEADFKGKKIVVSGKLVRIVKSKDEDDKPIYSAEISPDGKPAAVPLAFLFKEDQRDELRCLLPGQFVRIYGECAGRVTGEPALPTLPPPSEIQFKKCRVVD